MEPLTEFFKTRRALAAVLIGAGFFAFGAYVGFHHQPAINKVTTLDGATTAVDTKTDFSPFWKVWNTINEKYPDATKTTDQEKVYGAISGLVGSLNDPYSVFFAPDEAKEFENNISGSFGGIGLEVGIKDNILTVISPLKGTPAYNAGIKSGDKILKIDKTETLNLGVDQAIKLIRGDKGTPVVLTVLHKGEKNAVEVRIIRDTIMTPTLDTELRKDGIFVIKLYSFSANSANLFRNAVKEFADAHTDKLVLDLRGNPGGYLDSSVDIASWFLANGKPIVIEDYGNNQEQNIFRSKGYDVFTEGLKFVILIDGGSASASEILAGAMQDYSKAKLVGSQSYGKGSVQEVVNVTPKTILKITIAKWLTPNGTSISLKGLTPEYKVEMTEKDAAAKKDPQMDKAVELLNNWTPIPVKK